jgi:2'-hydroxyisoflavone reductase
MEYYGVRKLLCEQVVQTNFERHCIIRPGLIVGRYDSTFRFPYWIKRLSEQGEVLAPDGPENPTQFIDAYDIAVWITKLINDQPYGIYNAVGDVTTIGEFLELSQSTLNHSDNITYIPEGFLKENEVGCWMELPLWVYKDLNNFLKCSNDKAKQNGLTLSPTEKTIKEVKKWLQMSQKLPDDSYNLSRDKEKLVLEKYHATRK